MTSVFKSCLICKVTWQIMRSPSHLRDDMIPFIWDVKLWTCLLISGWKRALSNMPQTTPSSSFIYLFLAHCDWNLAFGIQISLEHFQVCFNIYFWQCWLKIHSLCEPLKKPNTQLPRCNIELYWHLSPLRSACTS